MENSLTLAGSFHCLSTKAHKYYRVFQNCRSLSGPRITKTAMYGLKFETYQRRRRRKKKTTSGKFFDVIFTYTAFCYKKLTCERNHIFQNRIISPRSKILHWYFSLQTEEKFYGDFAFVTDLFVQKVWKGCLT